ncbi:MAG TPA: hypothetical protein VKC57_15190 [Ktedonobacterales bacterium]|nr:hypothetical protein [Ktedonobacterales bacterium]
MFDPHSPYHRRMWHYDSDRPLSAAQLVALGSLDARTAALLWLLVERHHSLIVSGPTDPMPGVGKTTTLNALLGFLPLGSTLVYTTGMYEDFDFKDQVTPETTCVLANEVSDHLSIYMWGRVARTLLRLPQEGYAVATSCHADAIDDVLDMLTRDLRLAPADVAQLGVIVNIGLVGRAWPPRRRFLTVNFVSPELPEPKGNRKAGSASVRLLPLATWDSAADTFIPATAADLRTLAGITGMTEEDFLAALERRQASIESLAKDRGAGIRAMRQAVDTLAASEREGPLAAGDMEVAE